MKKRKVLILLCLLVVLVMAVTFVACNDVTHTVTFSGTGIQSFTQTIKDGGTASKPSDPTRDGYEFKEWQLNDEAYDFSKPVKSDLELMATWTAKTYTVTMNAGDGNTAQFATKDVTFGEAFSLGTATTAELMTFGGWAIDSTPITDENGNGLAVWNFTENKTVTAIWMKGATKDGFSFAELEDGTLLVTSIEGYNYTQKYGAKVTIPTTYNDKKVSTIGSMRYLSVSEVVISTEIKTISASAFANNNYIIAADLSAFKGTIGDNAFANSSLKMIDLGGTTAIGERAFANAPMNIVTIPDSVKTLGNEALLSTSIMEIGFAGNIPTLGTNVFGNGLRDNDEEVSFIASVAAWDKFVEGSEGSKAEAVRAKLGVQSTTFGEYSATDMQEAVQMQGIYHENGATTLVYRGLGMTASILDYETEIKAQFVDLYEVTHLHKFDEETDNRTTFVINNENKTVKKLTSNTKGEVIDGTVLYDYQGDEIVYEVPANITKIAGGAGVSNDIMRFVIVGNDVEEVGPSAFSFGQLFGIILGEQVTKIGEYAFFGQERLQDLIFEGRTAPTIGEGAFCVMVGMTGMGPSVICTQYGMMGSAFIYTPLSASGWWGDPDCIVFINAFNESLKDMDNLPEINGVAVEYSTDNFKQLETYSSYYYHQGNEISTPYGTVTMLGTGDAGYATVEYNQASGHSGVSYVRYYSMGLPGYSSYDSKDPKTLEFFYQTELGYNSTILNGRFVDDTFVVRGAEAGSFGEVGKDIFKFDGFGLFSYFGEDGTTTEGNYTVNGTTISFDTLEKTATFDATAKTLTYNNNVMEALGEGAGIYYDLKNAATLTVDGKPYTSNGVNYSGRITVEYKGQKFTVGYIMDGAKVTLTLNGKEREWSYSTSASSDYVFQGYFGPGDYDNQLKFIVAENGLIDTFTKDNISMAFDGYYTVTLTEGQNVKTGTYVRFDESNSFLLTIDDVISIAIVNMDNKTFEYASAPESGKWFTSSSANYAWYLDGVGNLIYFNGSYDFGTYTFDKATGALSVAYKGVAAANDEKGKIDLTNNIGTIAFNTGYGNGYVGISRRPFESVDGSLSVTKYGFAAQLKSEDGKISIVNGVGRFAVSKVGNFVFITPSGKPMEIHELVDGKYTFEFAVSSSMQASTFELTISGEAGALKANIVCTDFIDFGSAKDADGTTDYTFNWIDDTHVIVTYMSYGYPTVYADGTVTGSGASFTINGSKGEFTVTGYGTDNATISKVEAQG